MLSPRPWRAESGLLFFLRLFTSMFAGVLIVSWLHATDWIDPTRLKMLTIIVGTLTFHGTALWLTWLLLREHGVTWAEGFGFLSARLGRAIFLALTIGFGILPIAWSLGQLSARIME